MQFVTFRQLKEMKLCPWSRAHLQRLEDAGEYPKRVRLGQQRVVWVLAEVLEYNRSLAEKRAAHQGTSS